MRVSRERRRQRKVANKYSRWKDEVDLRMDKSESDEEYLLDYELKDTLGITTAMNESSEKAPVPEKG